MDELKNLPFDLYTRNNIIAELVGLVRSDKPLKILDIGGRHGRIKCFLPDDEVYQLDIRSSECNEEDYIQGDLLKAPFLDHLFDIVISSDLFEHISQEERENAILQMMRLSKNFIVLGAPFYSPEVVDAEKKANDYFFQCKNEPHPWLKEHIQNGLPSSEKLEQQLVYLNYEFRVIHSNNIFNWLLMQLFIFTAFAYAIPEHSVKEVYNYYNSHYRMLGDTTKPTYRKIYLIGRMGTLPATGFTEIERGSTSDPLCYQKLHTLIFEGINRNIQDAQNKITGFSQEFQTMQNQITALSQENKNKQNQILAISQEKQTLQNLITELSQENKNKQNQILAISQEKQDMQNLISAISTKEKQLSDVNIHLAERVKTLSSKEIPLQALTARLNDQEQKLSAIETSIIWQLTMKFHYKVVEKILPLNTRRRRYYDLGRAGGRILVNEGYPAFRQAVERYFHNGISSSDYQKWIIKNEPTLTELKRLKELSQNFSYRPKISIVTPVWNTDKKWLRAAIDSVIHQSYDNWELCIVDGGSTKRHISKILDEYSKKDSRIKVKILKENRGIAGNSNEALSLATGEFIGFLDHDDELAPFALYEIVKLLNQNQNADFIYSDEDKIDSSGKRKDPFFKPDWSPDLFLSCNYVCHFSVARKVLLDSVGGFRQGYDGSQDYDLFLRVTEQCPKTGILHIPKILYHWRMIPQSAASSSGAKPYAYDAAKRALSDAMSRRNIPIEGICDGYGRGYYKIKYKLIGTPQVSIIIPTKNNGISLSRCIASVIQKTTFSNFEILIVDNESSEKKTLDYYTQIQPDHQVKVLRYPQSFNISAMYNFAVSRTKAPYLIFLKDNAENITDDWITQMLNYAQQEDIGIVGGKICYPNNTIDSAGYILGITPKECGERMFGSAHKNFPSNHPGYFQFIQTVRNVSAISGICMMVKREAFMKAGGFDERLTQTGYDVDICLKIQNRGYSIIYSPYLQIYHHPEQYNNKQEESQKRREVLTELKYVGKKWASIINKGDPYYNPNLSLRCEDFSIQI